MSEIKTVKIIYYTGTGSSRYVAECFGEQLRDAGKQTSIFRLWTKAQDDNNEYDLLVVVFAVHAFNAPEPVYKWIDSRDFTSGTPAVVISVSGAGEISPNTACRMHCIKKLEKKGYNVIYEDMIVMPSNCLVATKEPIALLLLEVLPQKTKQIIYDVLAGFIRRTNPLLIDKTFSVFGEYEKKLAKHFGKSIKVSDNCTGCGWCRDNCPSTNITIEDDQPKFHNKCQMCLSCFYGCNARALSPGIGKPILIKGGYSFEMITKKLPLTYEVDIDALAKGYFWSGVKKYLANFRANRYE